MDDAKALRKNKPIDNQRILSKPINKEEALPVLIISVRGSKESKFINN